MARANYLVPDRPGISCAVKECARAMAAPTQRDWDKVVSLTKYLKGRPRLHIVYRFQAMPESLVTFTDSGWAGAHTAAGPLREGSSCLGATS